jgi:hypothetical protein
MTIDDTNIPVDGVPPVGKTSIRFGSAVLRATDEADHFGLFRPLVVIRNEDGKVTREQLEREVGPLAVYRKRGPGDAVPEPVGSLPTMIRTSDPRTGEPFDLILVWRPDTGAEL